MTSPRRLGLGASNDELHAAEGRQGPDPQADHLHILCERLEDDREIHSYNYVTENAGARPPDVKARNSVLPMSMRLRVGGVSK